MTYRLFVDSSTGVDVEPEFDYKFSAKKVETRHRARDGSEYVYKWGQYEDIKLTVKYVSSSFQDTVNTWWSNNTDLLWMEEGGTVVSSVHLINKAQPIDQFVKPYTDLWKGKIELGGY